MRKNDCPCSAWDPFTGIKLIALLRGCLQLLIRHSGSQEHILGPRIRPRSIHLIAQSALKSWLIYLTLLVILVFLCDCLSMSSTKGARHAVLAAVEVIRRVDLKPIDDKGRHRHERQQLCTPH